MRESSAVYDQIETFGDRRSGDLYEDVAHQRQVFDDVPVAVDDRMIDLRADLGDRRAALVRDGHVS